MEPILEIHIDMKVVDGKLKIAKAKSKFKGLLFWHEISMYELKNMICK